MIFSKAISKLSRSLHKNLIWRLFSSFSIKSKLKLIIMIVSSIGILTAGISMLIFHKAEIRNNMHDDLSTLTEIIAENVKTAIAFEDKIDTRKILSSLSNKKSIILAIIFDANGKIFASSSLITQTKNSYAKSLLNFDQYKFNSDYLEIKKPILIGSQKVGTLYVRSDYSSLNHAMNRMLYSLAVTLIIIGLAAYLLASYMQSVISYPLILLASVARKISKNKDYSLRAKVVSNDELGDLATDFNNMLVQVEKREKALIQSEKRFQTLIEQAVDSVYLFNLNGKILQVNPSACNSLEYSSQQLLKLSISDIYDNDDSDIEALWKKLKVDESITINTEFKKKNGQLLPVEIHFGRFDLDNDSRILAFARDITQRLVSQKALEEANDKLEFKVEKRTEQLSKINKELIISKEKAEDASRAKSDFLANMSHEIRTPMNAVMGFTELLVDSKLENKQMAYVTSIQSGARGLMTIINDVLDLSKIEAGKLLLEYESVDTYSFILDIEKIFSQSIKNKDLDFEIIIDQELPKALIIDQTRIRQILFNLIGNAIKFTQSGFIRVFVKQIKFEKSTSENSESKSSVDISFSVQDSGIGISEDQIENIFDQFVQHKGQSNTQFGGTGLGLTICNNLAKIMNGSILVQSTLGKGSTFTLQLNNIFVSSTSVQYEYDKESNDITFKPATILIVDDIKPNRTLVIEQLNKSNFSYLEAENGQQAVAMAKQHQPDLIIMDIRMPIMNGIEATNLIKNDNNLKQIPIIALTASVSKSDENIHNQGRFNDFLYKPVRKFEIIDSLKQFLDYERQTKNILENKTDKIKKTLPFSHSTTEEILAHIKQLNIIKLSSYQQAVSSGMINKIDFFINDLTSNIELIKDPSITKFASALISATQLFDIEKIELILPQYLTIISDAEIQFSQKEDSHG